MKISACWLTLLVALPFSAAGADRVAEASSGKNPPPGDMVLFPLDDESIPWRDNLKLTMQQPKKYSANPVLRPGPDDAVDGLSSTVYGTVIKQGSKFRMWYMSAARLDSRIAGDVERLHWYRPVAYAESTDGIHWNKPNLGLVDFRGKKDNNLVLIEPANEPYARPYDFIAVLHEPEEPDPSRRFKIAYITQDLPRGSGSTATAVSPDGLRWKLVNTKIFHKGHFENTSLIKFNGLYYVAGQNIPPYDGSLPDGSPAGRVMKVFFSPDFQHWSNGRALSFYRNGYVPAKERFGQEVHMGAGLWNRGNVVLGFYGRWYGDTIRQEPGNSVKGLKMDLGLVISNDGIRYREPVRDFLVAPHGGPDDWDSEGMEQANAFANTETETLIWYGTWNTSRPDKLDPLPAPLPPEVDKKRGIGLLTIPRDRFGYFSKLLAVSRERQKEFVGPIDASCLTRSLKLTRASQLFVNLDDVSASAALQIALVDDLERPLPGYTAKLPKSSLKAPVEWAGKKMLPANTPFRIKVTWPVGVDNAKLYALYIEQQ